MLSATLSPYIKYPPMAIGKYKVAIADTKTFIQGYVQNFLTGSVIKYLTSYL